MFVETLIASLALGALIGAGAIYVFVVDPVRRSNELLRRRVISEQMRTYAADARLAAFRLMTDRQRADNDRHSRKASLEVVR